MDINWKRISYENALKKAPTLPKGWYELARFSKKQRVEWIRALWAQVLPQFTMKDAIEKVDLEIHARKPVLKYMVSGELYWGAPPATMPQIARVGEVIDCDFPPDFCAFYQIHNGFFKEGESGILPLQKLRQAHNVLSVHITQLEKEMLFRGEKVNPMALVPFYEKRDGKIYQCFFKPWKVEGQMGNVQCALDEGYLADPQGSKSEMRDPAFETFTGWLNDYVESEQNTYNR